MTQAKLNEAQRGVLEIWQSLEQDFVQEGYARGRAKGITEEARRLLLRLGGQRFGEPGQQIVAAVTAMNDVDRLERLTDRLLQATGWQELLDTP